MPAGKANQAENLKMNSIKSPCIALQRKDSAPLACEWMCVSAPMRRRQGIYRQLLGLCKSCTKFHECSSLFAKGSQIPILGWQLGLSGENYVVWVFGVGSVATAGMMQELDCSWRQVGPSYL